MFSSSGKGEASLPKTHTFLEKVCHHILKHINHFAWRHEVCLLNYLSWQNLITSDNAIFMRLPWIWNSTFWLGVENFKKYREYDKMQNIRVCNKYKTWQKAIFPHFTRFYEHILLGPNQSLRNLLRFSSRCQDLIRALIRRLSMK